MRRTERIKRRNRRRRRLLSMIFLIGLMGLGMYFLLNSDVFKIKSIGVIGNKTLSKDDIISSSEIGKDENIFRIKKSQVKNSIENLPYIKEIEIKREFPDRIIIKVTEREESLMIQNISSYFIADNEGYILKQIDEIDDDLLLIRGINIRNLSLGANAFEEIDKEEIIDLIENGGKLGILKVVKEIDLEKIDDVNIQLNNGIDIAFGTLDNVNYKLGMLNEILKDIENKESKYKKIIMNKGSHPILVVDE